MRRTPRHGLSNSHSKELEQCGLAARLKARCPVTFSQPHSNAFQQLEFVGDAFLAAELSLWLVSSPLFAHATEHLLSTMCNRMACNAHLCYVYDVLELGLVTLDQPQSTKAKADVVEAAIGELSMAGGPEAVQLRAELIGTISSLLLNSLLAP